MNRFLSRIIANTILRERNAGSISDKQHSKSVLRKEYRKFIIVIKSNLLDIFLIILGIFSASFGLKGFLLSNHFIDGGVTGISLLISALTSIPLYQLIITINIPFIILGYKVMGRQFAIKTALAITGLSVVLAFVNFPDVTRDNLLVAIFGGVFLGAGIGFAIRGGAVIDGTEVLAIYLSRKLGSTIGDIIIFINVIIFSTAAYFLRVEIALYSMITYLAASKALDFIVEGIEEYIGVTIISTYNEEIRQVIITKLGRGVTIYKGKGGYGRTEEKNEIDILYIVITRLELNKLNIEIEKIDEKAFVVMHSVKDTKGGMIKKRPLKH